MFLLYQEVCYQTLPFYVFLNLKKESHRCTKTERTVYFFFNFKRKTELGEFEDIFVCYF